MAKLPTVEDREYWQKCRETGCIVLACYRSPGIHHAGTGMGGRKDHKNVWPLCHYHHQGEEGLHTLSRRVWCAKYGTEKELRERLAQRLLEREKLCV